MAAKKTTAKKSPALHLDPKTGATVLTPKATKKADLPCSIAGCSRPRWILGSGTVLSTCREDELARGKRKQAARQAAKSADKPALVAELTDPAAKARPRNRVTVAEASAIIDSLTAGPRDERPHVPAALVARRKAEKAALPKTKGEFVQAALSILEGGAS